MQQQTPPVHTFKSATSWTPPSPKFQSIPHDPHLVLIREILDAGEQDYVWNRTVTKKHTLIFVFQDLDAPLTSEGQQLYVKTVVLTPSKRGTLYQISAAAGLPFKPKESFMFSNLIGRQLVIQSSPDSEQGVICTTPHHNLVRRELPPMTDIDHAAISTWVIEGFRKQVEMMNVNKPGRN